jgi:hypothetical protein
MARSDAEAWVQAADAREGLVLRAVGKGGGDLGQPGAFLAQPPQLLEFGDQPLALCAHLLQPFLLAGIALGEVMRISPGLLEGDHAQPVGVEFVDGTREQVAAHPDLHVRHAQHHLAGHVDDPVNVLAARLGLAGAQAVVGCQRGHDHEARSHEAEAQDEAGSDGQGEHCSRAGGLDGQT